MTMTYTYETAKAIYDNLNDIVNYGIKTGDTESPAFRFALNRMNLMVDIMNETREAE